MPLFNLRLTLPAVLLMATILGSAFLPPKVAGQQPSTNKQTEKSDPLKHCDLLSENGRLSQGPPGRRLERDWPLCEDKFIQEEPATYPPTRASKVKFRGPGFFSYDRPQKFPLRQFHVEAL